LMGLGLGILLGVCAMILAEVVDHSIKSIEDIEELLGLEVVGTIPRIEDETTMKKTAGVRG
jgi:capsular polysaccharide biosynthesis protein